MVEKYKTPAIQESEKRTKEFETRALETYKERTGDAYERISKIVKERYESVSSQEGKTAKSLDVPAKLKELDNGKGVTEREKILVFSFLNRVADWNEQRAYDTTKQLLEILSSEKMGDAYDTFMNRTENLYGKNFREFLEAAVQTPPFGREYTTAEKFIIALDYHFAFVSAFPKEAKESTLEKISNAFIRGASEIQRLQIQNQINQIIVQKDDIHDAANSLFLLPIVAGASMATTETLAITYMWIAKSASKWFGKVEGTISASKNILAKRNANNLYSQMELSAVIGALGDAGLDPKGSLKSISNAIEKNKITTPSQLLDVMRFVYVCTTVTKQEPKEALDMVMYGIKSKIFKTDLELTHFVDSMDGIFRIIGKKEDVSIIVEKILTEAKLRTNIKEALEKVTEELINKKKTFDTFDTRIYKRKGIKQA
jgi:hypothetical protein